MTPPITTNSPTTSATSFPASQRSVQKTPSRSKHPHSLSQKSLQTIPPIKVSWIISSFLRLSIMLGKKSRKSTNASTTKNLGRSLKPTPPPEPPRLKVSRSTFSKFLSSSPPSSLKLPNKSKKSLLPKKLLPPLRYFLKYLFPATKS